MGGASVANGWRRARRSGDAGRGLGVLGPVMALLSETRRGNHQ
jgi:hypothetical protein